MGFGLFKKIKDAFKKASTWMKDKVIKPVVKTVKNIVSSPFTRKLIDTGVKLAPTIATAAGAAKGSPQAGAAIGSGIQSIGRSLGYG